MQAPIALLVSDHAVLSSLQFALSVEGFALAAAGDDLAAASAMVIDQGYLGDGLSTLSALRGRGNTVPALLLATNPTPSYRARAVAAKARVIEKPLLGDELSSAISHALEPRKVA